MEQRQIVSGFSELKDLLVQKYNIIESRERIGLYFTMSDGALILHHYKRHYQQVNLAEFASHSINVTLKSGSFANELIELALKEERPEIFLNQQFKLHGFFKF